MAFVPGDHGPIYAETGLGPAWLVEPWNTLSNGAFLIVLIYWLIHAPRSGPVARFFKFGLPILFLGWIGGTLYHGLRSSDLFYLLDYIPIYTLALWLSIALWARLGSLSLGATVVGSCLAFLFAENAWGSHSVTMYTLCYLALGVSVIWPLVILAHRSGWHDWPILAGGAVCFVCALVCRLMDAQVATFFGRGSHFLWHLLGAAAVHLGLKYAARHPLLGDAGGADLAVPSHPKPTH